MSQLLTFGEVSLDTLATSRRLARGEGLTLLEQVAPAFGVKAGLFAAAASSYAAEALGAQTHIPTRAQVRKRLLSYMDSLG